MTPKRLLFALAGLLATVALLRFAGQSRIFDDRENSLADSRPVVATAVPAVVRSLRPNYPLSIIPGGAYSPQELLSWLRRDPVVRGHYHGFDGASVRLVAAHRDILAYVSYRRDNKVFWTHKPLRIPKGELLLTDGTNFARARCGNRLAETLPPGTRLEEPTPPEVALPPFTMAMFRKGTIPSGEPPEVAGPMVLPTLPPETLTLSTPPAPQTAATEIAPLPPSVGPFVPAALTPSVARRTATPSATPTPPDEPVTPPTVPSQVPEPASLAVMGLISLGLGMTLRRLRLRRIFHVGSIKASTPIE